VNTLKSIKPFLQNVLAILSNSLNVEAAIIDREFDLVTCTSNYLQKKGTEVHIPSVQKVFEMGEMVVSKPGQMPSCKGCRFQNKCPASLEILNCIKLENDPIGIISLSVFNHSNDGNNPQSYKCFEQPLIETSKLISNYAKHELTLKKMDLYKSMLKQSMELSQDGMLLVNKHGLILDHNQSAQILLNKTKLKGSNLDQFMLGNKSDQLLGKEKQIDLYTQLKERDYLFQSTGIKQSEVFSGAIVTFNSCNPDQNQSSFLAKKDQDSIISKIKGSGDHIQAIKKIITKVSKTTSTILISGETGTGKELIAQVIHEISPRFKYPFIAINCAAIPDALLESELFGYESGAFTGAEKKGKPGYFEVANYGTLLLDEIGDMPLALQGKILRVLQERTISRVGGRKNIPLDIRIIAATNQNLDDMVAKKLFREDLYYRLNVIPIHLLPLKNRPEDISDLADTFLKKYAQRFNRNIKKISKTTNKAFEKYHWPGNIRELENCLEYAINIEESDVITYDSLPEKIKQNNIKDAADLKSAAENNEFQMIQEELKKYGSHLEGKKVIAEHLNISLRTLYRKLEKYGIR
jgi:sigma-54 dependent transcriptional regulator, acetoin dehydrogenase operon transcriptional activator AcoR